MVWFFLKFVTTCIQYSSMDKVSRTSQCTMIWCLSYPSWGLQQRQFLLILLSSLLCVFFYYFDWNHLFNSTFFYSLDLWLYYDFLLFFCSLWISEKMMFCRLSILRVTSSSFLALCGMVMRLVVHLWVWKEPPPLPTYILIFFKFSYISIKSNIVLVVSLWF